MKRFRMPADVSEAYGHVNTEVCEQWHASVDMLTRHVASMSQFHFMLTLQVVDLFDPTDADCVMYLRLGFR
jgi:hypothetical protein